MTLQLGERIQLRPSKELSHLCHLAKNLYNEANFHVRQFFFDLGEIINYYDLQVILKNVECYKALLAQTSQQILDLVAKNWKAHSAME
jgi:putative transposase